MSICGGGVWAVCARVAPTQRRRRVDAQRGARNRSLKRVKMAECLRWYYTLARSVFLILIMMGSTEVNGNVRSNWGTDLIFPRPGGNILRRLLEDVVHGITGIECPVLFYSQGL